MFMIGVKSNPGAASTSDIFFAMYSSWRPEAEASGNAVSCGYPVQVALLGDAGAKHIGEFRRIKIDVFHDLFDD